MSDEAHPHEIVIIKRYAGGHEDEHHGGVWKIAFADFMTAMMAFFLVMWLISANDKTRATIARYFNPVQLVDSTPQPRGLNDPKPGAPNVLKPEKPDPQSKPGKTPEPEAPPVGAPDKPSKNDDTELFKDPYAVLAELAAKNSVQPVNQSKAPSEGDQGGSGKVGAKGGEAYRDPFEPSAITPDRAAAADGLKAEPAVPRTAPPPDPVSVQRVAPKALAAPNDDKNAGEPPPVAGQTPEQDQATAMRGKIAAMVKQNEGTGAAPGEPKVEVRRTGEGLLISLTDDATFSMFAIASAEPAPKTVTLMEKIGRLLVTQKGRVTIRGFTDARPFRSDSYDNWRLSAARAHMAHYMLVRGGLAEARFDRIEGYADREPKNLKDPLSAENRRIEILVRDPAP